MAKRVEKESEYPVGESLKWNFFRVLVNTLECALKLHRVFFVN